MTRRTDNRVIAGVASGLGTYFGVDPVIFRIGFVALTLAGGTGLLIYLLLWALLPSVSYDGPAGRPPTGPAPGDPPIVAALRQGGVRSYLAIGAMVLAVLLLVGPFARPTVVFALLLIGVGVLLMAQDRPGQAPSSTSPWPPGPPAPPGGGDRQPGGEQWPQPGPGQAPQPSRYGQDPAGEPYGAAQGAATQPIATGTLPAWDSPTGQSSGGRWAPEATGATATPSGWGSAGSPGGWGTTPASVAERRPRPRSVLGWLTVAASLLAVGVASALDNLGVVNLTPARIAALMLTVVGVGLLVGSVRGRAWWLILLGLLLVPVMALAGVAGDVPVRGRTGQQFEQPLTLREVQPVYRLSAGQFTLDLREVDFGPQPHQIAVSMGAGDLTVIVPNDQPVTVTSSVGAGQVTVFGRPSNGGLQVRETVNQSGSSRLGRLTLDLHLGLGQIVVNRGP